LPHECVRPYEADHQNNGNEKKSPSHEPKPYFDETADFDDPTLEHFPEDPAEILRKLSASRARLPAPEVKFETIPTSPKQEKGTSEEAQKLTPPRSPILEKIEEGEEEEKTLEPASPLPAPKADEEDETVADMEASDEVNQAKPVDPVIEAINTQESSENQIPAISSPEPGASLPPSAILTGTIPPLPTPAIDLLSSNSSPRPKIESESWEYSSLDERLGKLAQPISAVPADPLLTSGRNAMSDTGDGASDGYPSPRVPMASVTNIHAPVEGFELSAATDSLKDGASHLKETATDAKEKATVSVDDATAEVAPLAENVKDKAADVSQTVTDTTTKAGAKATMLKEATAVKTDEAKDIASEKAQDTRHVIEESASYITDEAVEAKDAAISKADNTVEAVKTTASDVADKAAEVKDEIKDSLLEDTINAKNQAAGATAAFFELSHDASITAGHKAAEISAAIKAMSSDTAEKAIQNRDAAASKATGVKDTVVDKSIENKDVAVLKPTDVADKSIENKDAALAKAIDVKDAVVEKSVETKQAADEQTRELTAAVVQAENDVADRIKTAKDSTIENIEQAKTVTEQKASDIGELATEIKDDLIGQLQSVGNAKQAIIDAALQAKDFVVDTATGVSETAAQTTGDSIEQAAAIAQNAQQSAATAAKDASNVSKHSLSATVDKTEDGFAQALDQADTTYQNVVDAGTTQAEDVKTHSRTLPHEEAQRIMHLPEGSNISQGSGLSTSIDESSPLIDRTLTQRHPESSALERPKSAASQRSVVPNVDARNRSFIVKLWNTVIVGWLGGLLRFVFGGRKRQ
jgi:hypothetical protein